MTIKGTLTKFETNTYGYSVIWVSGTRYGSDKKGTINAEVGDLVSFEHFDKPSNKGDGKTWPTFQFQTFSKVAAAANVAGTTGAVASNSAGGVQGVSHNVGRTTAYSSGAAASRDSYWADKEARDIKKDERYQSETEPRIVFQSSYKLAVDFVDLALRNGAFDALAKAKPTAKLEVLQAFVSEQAARIMAEAYAAAVPPSTAPKAAAAELEGGLPESEKEADDSSWS